MRRKLKLGWPSPATVIAMVALCVAMSGTALGKSAVTTAKHLIGGNDIKNGSITGRDVKNGSITGKDVKNGSLTGKDVKNGSLTGKDVKNGSLTGKDVKNGSVSSADVKDSSLLAKDFKPGQLAAGVGASSFLTGTQGDARYLRSGAAAGGALQGTYPAPTIAPGAVTGATVADRSLTLSDLGGTRPDDISTTTTADIPILAGQCQAALAGNFGDTVLGDLVVGTLTKANGDAVLPNTAAFVPSVVIKTSQGGAVPNLTVCNTGGSTITIPAGSVFHWRLIGA